MPTTLQPGSTITTGTTSTPGLNITIGPNAPSYQTAFAVTDYNGYLIFWVTSKNNNPGAALVGGDNLVSCANVLAGSYICFHGGNEQYSTSGLGLQHVPANIWFPDGTTNQGAHIFTGTGAPSSSNIQGSALMIPNGDQTAASAVASAPQPTASRSAPNRISRKNADVADQAFLVFPMMSAAIIAFRTFSGVMTPAS